MKSHIRSKSHIHAQLDTHTTSSTILFIIIFFNVDKHKIVHRMIETIENKQVLGLEHEVVMYTCKNDYNVNNASVYTILRTV